MYKDFQSFLSNELESIEAAGLFKKERIITTPQQAAIKVSTGQEVLNFCANNYLGLSNNAELIKASKEALDSHGFGMSSVRFICGTQDLHIELEKKIAEFFGTEDSILYAACFDACPEAAEACRPLRGRAVCAGNGTAGFAGSTGRLEPGTGRTGGGRTAVCCGQCHAAGWCGRGGSADLCIQALLCRTAGAERTKRYSGRVTCSDREKRTPSNKSGGYFYDEDRSDRTGCCEH